MKFLTHLFTALHTANEDDKPFINGRLLRAFKVGDDANGNVLQLVTLLSAH